jgi:hypothetical protein
MEEKPALLATIVADGNDAHPLRPAVTRIGMARQRIASTEAVIRRTHDAVRRAKTAVTEPAVEDEAV